MGEQCPNLQFLDNGRIKLGVDMSKGAGISHFQLCDGPFNLLNAYDAGRLVQVRVGDSSS